MNSTTKLLNNNELCTETQGIVKFKVLIGPQRIRVNLSTSRQIIVILQTVGNLWRGFIDYSILHKAS